MLSTHGHDCSMRRLSSINIQDLVQPIEVDCSLVINGLLRVDVEEDPLKQPEREKNQSVNLLGNSLAATTTEIRI